MQNFLLALAVVAQPVLGTARVIQIFDLEIYYPPQLTILGAKGGGPVQLTNFDSSGGRDGIIPAGGMQVFVVPYQPSTKSAHSELLELLEGRRLVVQRQINVGGKSTTLLKVQDNFLHHIQSSVILEIGNLRYQIIMSRRVDEPKFSELDRLFEEFLRGVNIVK